MMKTTNPANNTIRSVANVTGLALLSLALLVGCSDKKGADTGASNTTGTKQDGHAAHEEHAGPHDGHVIELGRNHEYHAEIVDDETAKTVTVYILGKDMKELSIDAATIAMNLMVDGEAKSFELTAANASDGKASQFNAADNSLFEALHVHNAEGKLSATIAGSPYSGKVEHHDHGDHDGHDHDDHGQEH